jgi:hypothetical protein
MGDTVDLLQHRECQADEDNQGFEPLNLLDVKDEVRG